MSLQRNAAANYASQLYVTAVGIVAVPVYLRTLGAEAYGLIGFHALLQGWFQVLDLGLGPTLLREMARFRAGALGALQLRRLLRTLEALFGAVALGGGLLLALLAPWIASRWLNVEALPHDRVARAVALTAGVVALRWLCGLYRSAVSGLEQQVWLAGLDVASATCRSLLVIPVLLHLSRTIEAFFAWQLGVTALELLALATKVHRAIPAAGAAVSPGLESLRPVLRFSLTIAFTAAAWVAISNTDKLVLSKLLPLASFGTFTLGVLVASTVNLLGAPLGQALLPRLSALEAAGDGAGLLALYRAATQWAAALVAPVAVALVVFARPLLLGWTGDAAATALAAPILELYAAGNGLLAMAAFQYYLQYAKGELRLHLLGNLAFVTLLVPLLWVVARRYGAVGAGVVWLSQCAGYLLVWTWVVHRSLAPGLHWSWLGRDVLPVWGAVSLAGAALRASGVAGALGGLPRWELALALAGCGLLLALVGGAASPQVRSLAGRLRR